MNSPKIQNIRNKIREKETEINKLRNELQLEQDKENKKRSQDLVGKCYKKVEFCTEEYLKILDYSNESNLFKCFAIKLSYITGYHIYFHWVSHNYDIIEDYHRECSKEEFDSVFKKAMDKLKTESV